MNESRDMVLGRLLSEGAVPDHGGDYWDATRAAVAPVLEGFGRRSRTRRRQILQIAIAATAAAVAAVVVLVALPGLRGPSVASATAADMLASMNAASARSPRVVRLTYTQAHVTSDGRTPWPDGGDATDSQLTLSASGDLRLTVSWTHQPEVGAVRSTHTITYDEQRHERRQLDTTGPDDPSDVLVIERPSWSAGLTEQSESSALAGSVRARLAEENPDSPVTETTYLGRPAWHAVLHEHLGTQANPAGTDLQWRVTVDMATGLVLESEMDITNMTHSARVPLTEVFRVTRFEVDPSLPQGWDSIPEAGQGRIGIMDWGTRFGRPDELARRTDVPVLVPAWVPAGYRLTDAATMDAGDPKKSPKDKMKLIYLSRHNPRKSWWKTTSVDTSSQQVAIRYRRGFATLVVTTRPLKKGERPYASAAPSGAEAVTLSRGYLAGERVLTSVAPFLRQGPTLAVDRGGYRITVSGDLTQRELVAVANSLEQHGE
jgi:hypothetical protein